MYPEKSENSSWLTLPIYIYNLDLDGLYHSYGQHRVWDLQKFNMFSSGFLCHTKVIDEAN